MQCSGWCCVFHTVWKWSCYLTCLMCWCVVKNLLSLSLPNMFQCCTSSVTRLPSFNSPSTHPFSCENIHWQSLFWLVIDGKKTGTSLSSESVRWRKESQVSEQFVYYQVIHALVVCDWWANCYLSFCLSVCLLISMLVGFRKKYCAFCWNCWSRFTYLLADIPCHLLCNRG